MSTEKKIQAVKNFFAAIGCGDREGLLVLVAEGIELPLPEHIGPSRGVSSADLWVHGQVIEPSDWL